LFVFEDKQVVTYLKGVDPNFSQVNDIKKTLYNGQWIEPDTYQVVVIWNCTEILNGIGFQ
jgi:lipoprotein-releasing system permease protein